MREDLLLAGRIVDLPMTLFVIRFQKKVYSLRRTSFLGYNRFGK